MTGIMDASIPNTSTQYQNWPREIIENLSDFLLTLTLEARISYASLSCRAVTGHHEEDVNGKFISDYLHPDDWALFYIEFCNSISSGASLRSFYRFKKSDGTYVILECHGHPHMLGTQVMDGGDDGKALVVDVCWGLFMMARPYRDESTAFADSSLHHKTEDTMLPTSLAEPTDEGVNAIAHDPQHQLDTPSTHDVDTPVLSRDDDVRLYVDGAEPLTGLHLSENKRTWSNSPDDMPLTPKTDHHAKQRQQDCGSCGHCGKRKKKKNLKHGDVYSCTTCGALTSPEWRRGPLGRKTLCNACGLRWVKHERKMQTKSHDEGKLQI